MPLTRREAMAGFGGGLVLLTPLPAIAQTAYPSRTVKMIVPYPAGGTTDFLGRLVADQLKTGLGATVIVENKPGAATTLGAEQAARAEPDGYTLLMATSIGKLVAAPATRDKFTTIALEPLPGSTPDSFAAYVKTEVDRWAGIVKNSGAELE
jgi:tripartite-type tricarboxylate transporter receptor subunit TctC